APAVTTRPIPKGTAARGRPRVKAFEFRTIQPRASVSRIGFLSIQIPASHRLGVQLPPRQPPTGVHKGCDQGAFAAGIPNRESYNRAATPATIATSARLKTYQLKGFPPIWT